MRWDLYVGPVADDCRGGKGHRVDPSLQEVGCRCPLAPKQQDSFDHGDTKGRNRSRKIGPDEPRVEGGYSCTLVTTEDDWTGRRPSLDRKMSWSNKEWSNRT